MKGKTKIVYWSDLKTQRKLFEPQNSVYKNFRIRVLSIYLVSYRISAVNLGQ